jgi:septal ring factor EnvC (AmiA/AmiB activator)
MRKEPNQEKRRKGVPMKKNLRLGLGLLFIATILLSACAPPPPPITKDQLEQAEAEAIAAENNVGQGEQELKQLEQELADKKAELESLKNYKQELELQE